jgi:hypothetical protein
MPRLSLWRSEKANDYRYFDRIISEQFTVGATDILVHKYIGVPGTPGSTDLTKPQYDSAAVGNIQDLLFLENRDRKYDKNVYRIRAHYNVQNLDFDLSQFGLFLTNDILFLTVHINDHLDLLGRKLMVGDVLELQHLRDPHPLDETIPISLRRYYTVTDANFASEGFSQTWYPHLWRIKCEPMINSQEYKDILQVPVAIDNYTGDYDPAKEYEPGYTVTYNGKIYTPKKPVPPGISPDNPEYWSGPVPTGLTPNDRGPYDPTTIYKPGDTVTSGGITYIAIKDTPKGTPPTDPNFWAIKPDPAKNQGPWDPSTPYSPGDNVTENGITYTAIKPVPPGTPTSDTTYWAPTPGGNIGDLVSQYNTNIDINNAIIAEAERLVPASGFDRQQLYIAPTFEDGQPAPPLQVVMGFGTDGMVPPQRPLGRVESVSSPQFSNPSTVIRIPRANMVDASSDAPIDWGTVLSLGSAETAPDVTDGGSGPVGGQRVMTLSVLGPSGVTGPYGTTDNEFSRADQHIRFVTTARATPSNSNVVNLVEISPDLVPGLRISAFLYNGTNNSTLRIFPQNTRTVSTNSENNTVSIDARTLSSIPAGVPITFAEDFDGVPTSQMDYRADADPRFNYIRRNASPRTFGWIAGYLTGNGIAPNGEPLSGAGITFPGNPAVGDYYLRIDYFPQKLFRWSGKLWVEISRKVRTGVGFDSKDESQLSLFINNSNTTTALQGGVSGVVPERQSLSKALSQNYFIKPD